MQDDTSTPQDAAQSNNELRIGDEFFHQTIEATGLFHPNPGEQPTDPFALGPWHIVHQHLDDSACVVLLWRRSVDFAAVERAGLLAPVVASIEADEEADDPENTLESEIVERVPEQTAGPGGLLAHVTVKEIQAPPIPQTQPTGPTPVDLARYPDRTRHHIPGPGGVPPITPPTAPVPAQFQTTPYAVRPASGAPPIAGYAPPGPVQTRAEPTPQTPADPARDHTISPTVDPAVSYPRTEVPKEKLPPLDVTTLRIDGICRCDKPRPQRTTNGAQVCTACRKRHLTDGEKDQLRAALA